MIKVSLLSQILQLIPRDNFNKLVSKHGTDKHSKGLNSWTHLVSMVFCHLSNSTSLREISAGLLSATGNLSHLGLSRSPCRSSLSYMNKHRDAKFFQELYYHLYDMLSPQMSLSSRNYARRIRRKIYIMDATVIPLCLSLFDWAVFRQKKGAVKLHTVLDYDTCIPVFMNMTDGKTHEITIARDTVFPSGSVLLMDKAYVDYAWLNVLDSTGVFFVTRLKDNANIEEILSRITNQKHTHILADQDIVLAGNKASEDYSKPLRIVTVQTEDMDKPMVFLTNQMFWTADTISQLYQARWQIESFFKDIKQHLKIKTFIGTSSNAVLIQVWTALISILLLRYLKTKAEHQWHLSNLVGFLRINLMVKIDLWYWVNHPFIKQANAPPNTQLKIF